MPGRGLLLPPSGIVVPNSSQRRVFDDQKSFAGGLNTVSNDFALRLDQMRRSDNARLVDIGAATKRGGTQRTSSAVLAAAGVKNGFAWRNGSTVQHLAMCDGHLFTAPWGSLPLTWTDRSGSFSTSTTPSFASFRNASANMCYIATGGALQRWSGSALTSLPNPVQAAGICVHNNRLWGWGVSGALDSVYYSNLSDASSTTGGDSLGYGAESGGQIVVRTFGQADIVVCLSVGTSLMILHKGGISRITGYGQSDISVAPAPVTSKVGCVGKEAACAYETVGGVPGFYFVSERGVYEGNEQGVAAVATPDKPDPVLPQLLTLSAANLALVKCQFNSKTRELWVQLPGIGVYVFNTLLRSWAGPFIDGYLSPDTTSLFEGLDSNNQPIMLRGDASGWVSLCDPANVFLDNVAAAGTGGSSYDLIVRCRRMFSGDPTRANAYRWAKILADLKGSTTVAAAWTTLSDSGSVQLDVSSTGPTAWGGSGSTWGQGTWGVGGQNALYVPLSGAGPFLDFSIIDSGQAASQYASVQIEGVSMYRR